MLVFFCYKIINLGFVVVFELCKLNVRVLIEFLRFELVICFNFFLFFFKLVDVYCKEFVKYDICYDIVVCDFEGFV